MEGFVLPLQKEGIKYKRSPQMWLNCMQSCTLSFHKNSSGESKFKYNLGIKGRWLFITLRITFKKLWWPHFNYPSSPSQIFLLCFSFDLIVVCVSKNEKSTSFHYRPTTPLQSQFFNLLKHWKHRTWDIEVESWIKKIEKYLTKGIIIATF